MCTVTLKANIDDAGHIKLDVQTGLPPGEAEVVVMVHPASSIVTGGRSDLRQFIGKLQWEGDAVAEQRKLRDEWPD